MAHEWGLHGKRLAMHRSASRARGAGGEGEREEGRERGDAERRREDEKDSLHTQSTPHTAHQQHHTTPTPSGVANFEHFVALQRWAVPFDAVTRLYSDPCDLSCLEDETLRAMARSMIEQSVDERYMQAYADCTAMARELASTNLTARLPIPVPGAGAVSGVAGVVKWVFFFGVEGGRGGGVFGLFWGCLLSPCSLGRRHCCRCCRHCTHTLTRTHTLAATMKTKTQTQEHRRRLAGQVIGGLFVPFAFYFLYSCCCHPHAKGLCGRR